MAETTETPACLSAPEEPAQQTLKLPTAFTVLAAVLLVVAVASFFVPAGAYEVDPETDGRVPGTYGELPWCSEAQGDELCVETSFDAVYTAWGTPEQHAIRSATPDDLAGSQFAEGSMAPKVRAACWFVERTGGFAAIGSIHDTQALVRGEAGTRVALDAARTG
jgi:hypothetical protein